ncbi:MAG: HAMP domain-containing protein [Candidatus Nanopelagicales bacterium]|jgi:signal transduction histidine kinase|nr:HAMP domain-containing protein [Candidatus Nanopelagicales bacterium]
MYRRLVTFALLVVTVAATVLVIPLALSARDLVRSGNLSALSDRARSLADAWESAAGGTGEDSDAAPVIRLPGDPGEVVLVYPNGAVVGGPVPVGAAGVVVSATAGSAASVDTGSSGYAAAPAVFGERIGVVLTVASPEQMNQGLGPRLLALAGLCALLLVGAGLAAWQLARRTAAPIRRLAGTADVMAAGELTARAEPSRIPEVDDVGVALNRLAARVQELLQEERAAAAELAHQLRTPLTVLAADVDAVADPVVRQRLNDDVLTLQRTTDEIITSARRTSREGLRASCDAAAVVADRAAFWAVLAEYQGRDMQVEGAGGDPLPVRLTEYDLSTAVDILLQNVFVHTDEGVPLRLSVRTEPEGMVAVSVEDAGPGLEPQGAPGERPGSTSLGLAIAERLAQASGGRLERGSGTLGGARVVLLLGPG